MNEDAGIKKVRYRSDEVCLKVEKQSICLEFSMENPSKIWHFRNNNKPYQNCTEKLVDYSLFQNRIKKTFCSSKSVVEA